MHFNVPMCGSSTRIPMIEELVTSPHFIVIPRWVRIDCLFVNLLFSNVPCHPCVFEEPLLYHLVSLLASHLLLLNVRSFLFTQIAQSVMPLSRSQFLENLLKWGRNFLNKYPMLPIQWFPRPLLSWPSFHCVDNSDGEIPCFVGHLQSQNLCVMVSSMFAMHIWYLTSMSTMTLALHEFTTICLC
jgi:hypothetical protein